MAEGVQAKLVFWQFGVLRFVPRPMDPGSSEDHPRLAIMEIQAAEILAADDLAGVEGAFGWVS